MSDTSIDMHNRDPLATDTALILAAGGARALAATEADASGPGPEAIKVSADSLAHGASGSPEARPLPPIQSTEPARTDQTDAPATQAVADAEAASEDGVQVREQAAEDTESPVLEDEGSSFVFISRSEQRTTPGTPPEGRGDLEVGTLHAGDLLRLRDDDEDLLTLLGDGSAAAADVATGGGNQPTLPNLLGLDLTLASVSPADQSQFSNDSLG